MTSYAAFFIDPAIATAAKRSLANLIESWVLAELARRRARN
jgi:hypothetical protein